MFSLFNSQPIPVSQRIMRRIAGDILTGAVSTVAMGTIAAGLQLAGLIDFFDFVEPWAVLFAVLLLAAGAARRPSPLIPPMGTAIAITAGAWGTVVCFAWVSPATAAIGLMTSVLLVRLGSFVGEARRKRTY